MTVSYSKHVLAVLLGFGLTAPAAAQQGVYITQIDPTAAVPAPRTGNQNAVDSRLLATNPAVTGLPIASPATSNSLSAIVTGAGQSGPMTAGQLRNIAEINQTGSGNRGTINQSGSDNNSIISQTGQFNNSFSTTSGISNNTYQRQEGIYNQSSLRASGESNILTNIQTGNSNSSNISVVGSGYNIKNIQDGSGLFYNFNSASTNPGDKYITIEQRSISAAAAAGTIGLSSPTGGAISTRPTR
ncbi:hypothetical protein [Methylobacterium sp. Leaf99]|uniref:hypothetical protein n=1 Tax=Methylobacterium sp. Leaf99 TaxID=1736251 RepID=UPI0009E6F268|nr:hypothetical protein [Methylobacterium sp. Leaf99]